MIDFVVAKKHLKISFYVEFCVEKEGINKLRYTKRDFHIAILIQYTVKLGNNEQLGTG